MAWWEKSFAPRRSQTSTFLRPTSRAETRRIGVDAWTRLDRESHTENLAGGRDDRGARPLSPRSMAESGIVSVVSNWKRDTRQCEPDIKDPFTPCPPSWNTASKSSNSKQERSQFMSQISDEIDRFGCFESPRKPSTYGHVNEQTSRSHGEMPADIFNLLGLPKQQHCYGSGKSVEDVDCDGEEHALLWIQKAGAAFARGFYAEKKKLKASTEKVESNSHMSRNLKATTPATNIEQAVGSDIESLFTPKGAMRKLFTQLEQLERSFGVGVDAQNDPSLPQTRTNDPSLPQTRTNDPSLPQNAVTFSKRGTGKEVVFSESGDAKRETVNISGSRPSLSVPTPKFSNSVSDVRTLRRSSISYLATGSEIQAFNLGETEQAEITLFQNLSSYNQEGPAETNLTRSTPGDNGTQGDIYCTGHPMADFLANPFTEEAETNPVLQRTLHSEGRFSARRTFETANIPAAGDDPAESMLKPEETLVSMFGLPAVQTTTVPSEERSTESASEIIDTSDSFADVGEEGSQFFDIDTACDNIAPTESTVSTTKFPFVTPLAVLATDPTLSSIKMRSVEATTWATTEFHDDVSGHVARVWDVFDSDE